MQSLICDQHKCFDCHFISRNPSCKRSSTSSAYRTFVLYQAKPLSECMNALPHVVLMLHASLHIQSPPLCM